MLQEGYQRKEKKRKWSLILLTCIFFLSGCSQQVSVTVDSKTTCFEKEETSPFRIGVVFDEKGIEGDLLNQNVWDMLLQMEQRQELTKEILEVGEEKNYQEVMEQVLVTSPEIFLGVGHSYEKEFKQVSEKYKENTFVTIDMKVQNPNVISLQYRDSEILFLMGVYAGLLSEQKEILFFCQEESAQYPFLAGIKQVNKEKTAEIRTVQSENISDFVDKESVIALFQVNSQELNIQEGSIFLEEGFSDRPVNENTVVFFEKKIEPLLEYAISQKKLEKLEYGIHYFGIEDAIAIQYVGKGVPWVTKQDFDKLKKLLLKNEDSRIPNSKETLEKFRGFR